MALKVASSNLATHLILLLKKELNNTKSIKKINKTLLIQFNYKISKKNIQNLNQFEQSFKVFLKILNLNIKGALIISKQNYQYMYITYFNKSLNLIKNKIGFKNQFYLFILNLKKKKPFVNVMVKKYNKISLSIGIVLKYLNIKEKKLKKKLSSLYLMLKIIILMLAKEILAKKKIIFEIKGVRKDIYLIIKFLKVRFHFNYLTLIHTPNIIGNSLKYKKIRAIKKNLKKKLIKIN